MISFDSSSKSQIVLIPVVTHFGKRQSSICTSEAYLNYLFIYLRKKKKKVSLLKIGLKIKYNKEKERKRNETQTKRDFD